MLMMSDYMKLTWSVQEIQTLEDWRPGGGADQSVEECSTKLLQLSEWFLGVHCETVTWDGGIVSMINNVECLGGGFRSYPHTRKILTSDVPGDM